MNIMLEGAACMQHEDGTSKGCGIVEFNSARDAMRAISLLSNSVRLSMISPKLPLRVHAGLSLKMPSCAIFITIPMPLKRSCVLACATPSSQGVIDIALPADAGRQDDLCAGGPRGQRGAGAQGAQPIHSRQLSRRPCQGP